MGSAPSESNLAVYSGVLTVIVRFGAAVRFATGTGVDVAGFALAVCVAGGTPLVADGLGDAPGCAFCGGFGGENKYVHKIRIVDESIKANKTRFWFIFTNDTGAARLHRPHQTRLLFDRIVTARMELMTT
jgi:hypothetical protein